MNQALYEACQEFLLRPCRELELRILHELRAQGSLNNEIPAHIEYGCVEHGVIHVCCFAEPEYWLELDPKARTIEKVTA